MLNAMCLWPCWWRRNKLRRLGGLCRFPTMESGRFLMCAVWLCEILSLHSASYIQTYTAVFHLISSSHLLLKLMKKGCPLKKKIFFFTDTDSPEDDVWGGLYVLAPVVERDPVLSWDNSPLAFAFIRIWVEVPVNVEEHVAVVGAHRHHHFSTSLQQKHDWLVGG